ncbi:hypothetical protein [Klebsiella pneumoniae]|uniref:hypothetical protein n=1 Tax=Klebsiella pneumoniae TaxID=573 RepID=UPI0007CBD8DD|nr:hypothetical protein [Klebsiella pneumoniae]SBJ80645.1 Uncharacterised protein [Klebsiella pneumoniae]
MTNNQLTRKRLEKIKSWRETYGAGSNVMLPAEEAEELARMALAAMDSEPVGFTDERNLHHIAMGRETSLIWGKQNSEAGDVPLYRHAQPAPVSEPVFFIEVEGDDWINAGRIEGKNRQDLGLLPDGINYLYAAPQPAPVVPDAEAVYARLSDHEKWSTSLENVNHVLNACRAAMLASAPQEVK